MNYLSNEQNFSIKIRFIPENSRQLVSSSSLPIVSFRDLVQHLKMGEVRLVEELKETDIGNDIETVAEVPLTNILFRSMVDFFMPGQIRISKNID